MQQRYNKCEVFMDIILFGTGWRSKFYLRIARALPALLNIRAVCTRHAERAEALRKEGVEATTDISYALSLPHDAVIVASGNDGFVPLMKMLGERNEFVISETSFLRLSEAELDELGDMKGAVAEQYRYTPLYASLMASLHKIGPIDQLFLSGLHNHHAASIARDILTLGDSMPDDIKSLDFPSEMRKTAMRDSLVISGGLEEYVRKIRIMRFGNKLFINDFSSNQYHSYLYGKQVEIRGENGFLTEMGLHTVTASGYPCSVPFVFHRDWVTGNSGLTLSHVTLGEECVFANPFYPAMLNDDEIAIAILIKRIESGDEYPTIFSGILDARLGKLL